MFILGVTVFTSMFYSDRGLLLLGSGVEMSLMLAWEIHNHWSCCWTLIRPAVFSLKGQKSIPLHYRQPGHLPSAGTHTHTHPNDTQQSRGSLYVLRVWFLSFPNNMIERLWVYTVIQGLFSKKQQRAFSTQNLMSDDLWWSTSQLLTEWCVLSRLSHEHCLWWSQVKPRTTF